MPLLERYILRRTTLIFLLTLAALVATLWVTQVLRQLDVVTAKSQAIWVFLLMTVLALPALIQVVAPVAFLIATVVTLNGLTSDSELPVISAAGAPPRTIHRPILVLAALVMLVVALSHHILAPASLSGLRGLLTRVRADVIATLIQDGGFRAVDSGLTMHIRQKMPDGGFRGIFINDDRNPNESLQYSAASGLMLEQAGGSYLILQNGDIIREDRVGEENNVVAFETYALDLSQIGAPNAAAILEAKERSTLYLMDPRPDDTFVASKPERVAYEIHSRVTAPLYTLAFALIALAFLGRPRTSRQDRSIAIAAVVLLCLVLRGGGFAFAAAARGSSASIPFLYAVPLTGIVLAGYGVALGARLRIPRLIEAIWSGGALVGQRALRWVAPSIPAERSS
jgi:lipopolysaccharide export system permease protein